MEMTTLFIQLFVTFFVIGLFTFGGGYAMLSLIQTQVVTAHAWISESLFTDIVAISQMTPGPIGVNCATYVGYDVVTTAGGSHLLGVLGSFTATLAVVLPSFLMILLIAMVFSGYQDNPVVVRIFKGIRPVVVSLIAVPMVNMARKNNKSIWAWLLTGTTLVLVAFLRVSPIWILLVLIVLATAYSYYKEKRTE